MERQQIESLLEKYFAGNTSLAEEKQLQTYFRTTSSIPAEWQEYRLLFGYFEAEQEKEYKGEIFLPAPRSYKWVGIVASMAAVILALWVFEPFANTTTSAGGNSIEAAQNAKSLFMIMGNAPKEGKENLEYLNELNALQIKGSHSEKESLKPIDSTKNKVEARDSLQKTKEK